MTHNLHQPSLFKLLRKVEKAGAFDNFTASDVLFSRTLSSVDSIYDDWARLWARDPYATAFSHPAWHQSYISAHPRVEPIIVVLLDASGDLVGVCPLMRRRQKVCFLSTPRPDFMRPTLHPQIVVERAVDLILQEAGRAARGANIELAPFHPADPLAAVFAERACAAAIPVAVYGAGSSLRLSDAVQPNAIREKFEGSRHIRKHLSRLRRQGGYVFERVDDRAEIFAELPKLFALQTRRWIGSGNQIFLDGQNQAFYKELIIRFPLDILHFSRLKLHGCVAALSLDFVVGGVFQHYKAVFDVEQRSARPGLALLCENGRSMAMQEVHTLDFGRGDNGYKRRFANEAAIRQAVVLYPDNIARVIHQQRRAAIRYMRLVVSALEWRAAGRLAKARLRLIQSAIARHGVDGVIARLVERVLSTSRRQRTLLFELPNRARTPHSPKLNLSFRPGSLTDLLDVVELCNRVDRAAHFKQLADRLESGQTLFLGRWEEQLIFAGWLVQSAVDGVGECSRPPSVEDDFIYIEDCFTAPDYRHLGVFRDALDWVMAGRNAGQRVMSACGAKSHASIRALENAGFVRKLS